MQTFSQIVYLVIGFIFGVLTSVIKINIENKKRNLELIKEWLSDIAEEFTISVEFEKNFERASYLWGAEMHKEASIKLLRSNASMIGLIRSSATTKKIRDAAEGVLSRRAQGQNALHRIRIENSEPQTLNSNQIGTLELHLSQLTDSIEHANKIIAEYENTPLRMLIS
jgi:hypothetical protein